MSAQFPAHNQSFCVECVRRNGIRRLGRQACRGRLNALQRVSGSRMRIPFAPVPFARVSFRAGAESPFLSHRMEFDGWDVKPAEAGRTRFSVFPISGCEFHSHRFHCACFISRRRRIPIPLPSNGIRRLGRQACRGRLNALQRVSGSRMRIPFAPIPFAPVPSLPAANPSFASVIMSPL